MENATYYYKVMPFRLKNAGATYQTLMNLVFANQIGKIMEVYVNDMVTKMTGDGGRCKDLREIFTQIRKFNMLLNMEKCAFGVRGGKFLEFLLTS